MGWVSVDSHFHEELEKTNRKFTRMEATFCLTYDLNYNRPWTIKRYSKMWGWSRNRVRKFIRDVRSKKGSVKNGIKNQKGHPIRLIGNGSEAHKDTPLNQKGHPKALIPLTDINHRDTQGSKRTLQNVGAVAYSTK